VDEASGHFRQRSDARDRKQSEVAHEWRSQIEAVGDVIGRTPSHINAHHGYHRDPAYAPLIRELVATYGFAVRSGGVEVQPPYENSADYTFRAWTGRLTSPGDFLAEFDASLPSASQVCEIVSHPGRVDTYLSSVSSLTHGRESDASILDLLNDMDAFEMRGLQRSTFAGALGI